jgi:hypothetical protein
MKNNLLICAFFFFFISLGSCVKKFDTRNLSDISATKVFEIAPSDDIGLAGGADRLRSSIFNNLPTPQILKIPVYLSTTAGIYNTDVTVILQLDTAAIANYNNDSTVTKKLTLLPDSIYSLPTTGLSVTIPAGQQIGYLDVSVIASKINPNISYMLAFKIVGIPSDGIISDTKSSAKWIIGVNNKYDGVYRVKGYIYRNLPPIDVDKTGPLKPFEVGLVTKDVNKVQFSILQQWADATGVGIGYPYFVINPVNNKVTIGSTGTGSATSVASNVATYNSRFEPKHVLGTDTIPSTFFVQFTWGGGITSRLCTDTLEFIRYR